MKALSAVLELIYPPRCPFCGRLLERGEDGLCARCQRSLPWTPEKGREVDFCETCLSPLRYQDGVVQAVHRYKFGHGRSHAALLGTLMAQCLADRWGEPLDAVTWVPLSKRHLRSRGYDQAELLARAACRRWDTRPERLLRKAAHTPAQSGLKDAAARRANVLGVYEAVNSARIAGRRILLIDDVCTTGATLAECARVLRDAGAEDVVCAVLALDSKKRANC